MKGGQNIKILFVFRFFSGLQSLTRAAWEPEGVPTIYKLLEGVQKQGKSSKVIFLCKTLQESRDIKRIIQVRVGALSNFEFTIVPFYQLIGIARVDGIVNAFIQFLIVIKHVRQAKPLLLYCDRAHLVFGAFFALFKRPKIIIRMLGVAKYADFYGRYFNALLHPLRYFAIKARFAYVICSKDGSPTDYVLGRYLNKRTPYVVWLNGVEKQNLTHTRVGHVGQKIQFLFVGRIEQDKGILELVEAIKKIKEQRVDKEFKVKIVGTGALESETRRRVDLYQLGEYIEFTGQVFHNQILEYYDQADVYISLNRLGNLSNTVLEALSLGKCMILLKGDGVVDKDTDEILSEDVAFKVDRNNIVDDLAEKIKFILDNPNCISQYAEQTKKLGQNVLIDWERRIDNELSILKKIYKENAPHDKSTYTS